MKRILVTGCSGFLGGHLIRRLADGPGVEIFGLTEVEDFTSAHCGVQRCDIRDGDAVEAVVAKVRPDVIYHLAAVANVGFSWKHPRLTYEVNFIGSANLVAAAARTVPDVRLLLLSSAELYGPAGSEPIREETGVTVRNPYALSKLAMEMVGDMYATIDHLDILKIRAFNFTGPGQNRQFVSSDFAHQIVEIERGRREALIRVGNLEAVRDISDVRDVCRYLTVLADRGAGGEIYNLCSGRSVAIDDILQILLGLSPTSIRVEVEAERLRPVDVPVLTGDCRKIRDGFGLKPCYTLEQTLEDLLNDWRSRSP